MVVVVDVAVAFEGSEVVIRGAEDTTEEVTIVVALPLVVGIVVVTEGEQGEDFNRTRCYYECTGTRIGPLRSDCTTRNVVVVSSAATSTWCCIDRRSLPLDGKRAKGFLNSVLPVCSKSYISSSFLDRYLLLITALTTALCPPH